MEGEREKKSILVMKTPITIYESFIAQFVIKSNTHDYIYKKP